MTTLREAAQQALEALEAMQSYAAAERKGLRICDESITALKAALAQQAEPVQEPYTDDVARIMREAGMTFHLGLPHKAVVEQMTRVVDLVYAEASIKAAQQFAAAPPQRKPLTEEEAAKACGAIINLGPLMQIVRAVERAHGIGDNT